MDIPARTITRLKRWSASTEQLNNNIFRTGSEKRRQLWCEPSCARTTDDVPFSIPKSYKMKEHRPLELMKSIDLSQYGCQQTNKGLLTDSKLGELVVSLFYDMQTEKLTVEVDKLDSLCTPSTLVTGSNGWKCIPTYDLWILPDKRKAKRKRKLTEDGTKDYYFIVPIKKPHIYEKTLRICVYDTRFKHSNLAVGHVLIPLRNTEILNEPVTLTKNLTKFSQPAGNNRGKLTLSGTWNTSKQQLDIVVGSAASLKAPEGAIGRAFFTKVIFYVEGKKHEQFKTRCINTDETIEFKERFTTKLTLSQLLACSVVCHVFTKQRIKLKMRAVLIGSTAIRPYMKRRGENELTHWEKIITSPNIEIEETHILTL